MNSITGSIPPYAGGLAVVGRATAPIDAQGNFSVPVGSEVVTRNIVLNPPLGMPYAPLSLSVAGAIGAHNITAQIAGALTVVGSFIGLDAAAGLGTNAQGFATPLSGNATAIRTGTATNTDLAGTLTAVGGVASYTFAGKYTTAPIVIPFDLTTPGAITGLTVTATGFSVACGTTDSIAYICIGLN